MKKILLLLVLFTALTKAQIQQDYYNQSPSRVPPVIGMNDTESESVKMANEALKANKQSEIGQKLEKSLEKVENLETPKFEDVYQNTSASENRSYNQSGNNQTNPQNNEVDPFSSPEDKSPSFQGEKVNVDEHYIQQPDGNYIKKDTGYQQPSNNSGDNTILIVVILIVGAGIIGAIVTNSQKKSNNDHDNFK